MTESLSYRAPALEKGLDILELVANETAPLTLSQVSEKLGRSKGEIFRMLQVLEERGYISRGPSGGFSVTNQLFMLGMVQPPIRSLLETALPHMQRLAEELWQSCHLVVASADEIVVIARVDSPGDVGYAVRLGHRRPIAESASGVVLFAFQPATHREKWLKRLFPRTSGLRQEFAARADKVRAAGYERAASLRVNTVTDLSAPIFQDERAIATITIPFMKEEPQKASIEETLRMLLDEAGAISRSLRFGSSSILTPNFTS